MQLSFRNLRKLCCVKKKLPFSAYVQLNNAADSCIYSHRTPAWYVFVVKDASLLLYHYNIMVYPRFPIRQIHYAATLELVVILTSTM